MEEGEAESVGFIYLKEGPGTITATVREPGGGPVEGAVVSLFSPQGTLTEETLQGGTTLTFDAVPFGNWGVRVAPPEVYLDQGEVFFEQDGLIIEEGSQEAAEFVLEKCLGTLRARVRNPEQNPVPDFPVRVYQPQGTVEEGTTGADGTRAFGPLMCRNFGLALMPKLGWEYEEGSGKSYYDGLKVNRGEERTLDFTVEACWGRIEARVRDQGGAAVPGTLVTLYTGQGDLEEGTTDVTGTRRFDHILCGREYGVRVTPPAGYTVVEGRGSSFFDGLLPRGPVPVVLEFTLQKS